MMDDLVKLTSFLIHLCRHGGLQISKGLNRYSTDIDIAIIKA